MGKTDTEDVAVIANQARMRVDLREPLLEDTLLAELRMLTAHRAGLAADHTRTIDRLRVRLRGFIPALERRTRLHQPRAACAHQPAADNGRSDRSRAR
ncbi:IS110 family transposase [Micromonospora tulbaghiae]|uniref:IS110 family transposase n=1 Tax=Micromonospora TaxID=1873 RepID=UPI00197C9573|nr:transposase [Micromonospora tulbaghiae]